MICIKCKVEKPEEQFSLRTDTGKRRNSCRLCEYLSRDRRRRKNLKKDNAKTKANQAVKAGVLKQPKKCEDCKKPTKDLIKHHEDYTKPLEINWVCRKCHAVRHKKKRKAFHILLRPLRPIRKVSEGGLL